MENLQTLKQYHFYTPLQLHRKCFNVIFCHAKQVIYLKKKKKEIYHRGIKGASSYLRTPLTLVNCDECPLENAAFKPLQLKCLDTLVSRVVLLRNEQKSGF